MLFIVSYSFLEDYNTEDLETDTDIDDDEQSSGDKLTCIFCNLVFTNKETYKEHEVTHLNYKCNVCGKRYFKETFLKQHQKNAHLKSKNLKCPICNNVFKTVYNLKQHLFTHSNERNYSCSFENCNKQFRQISTLQAHEKIHKQDNRKECPECKRLVTRLKEHMLTHLDEDEKPLKCNRCDKAFATKIKLEEHQNIHKNLKHFECDICCKNFNRRSTLYKHKKIHTDKNFSCTHCNKNYSRKDNLQQHIRKSHNDLKND